MFEDIKKRFNSADSYISLALGLGVVLIIGAIIFNIVSKKPDTTTKTEETKQEEQSSTSQGLPATHTVKANETLWSIAETYYKSGYNWVSIKDANKLTNPDEIEVGQTLTIPDVKPISVEQGQISAASTQKAKDTSYTVVNGDYLWKIAENEYGNGYKWVDIAKANKLEDPGLIHAGNVLVLP